MTTRGPKPRVSYAGRTYSCRRWNVDVPDLDAMTRMEALVWLNANTTPTGYSRPANPLAGFGGAVKVSTQ